MKKHIVTFFCIRFFIVLTPVAAQPFRNLVFEGAGIRGVAYVGAIKVLEEGNLLQSIKKVGGTSAGAIAALTVALGYSSHDIEQIMSGM